MASTNREKNARKFIQKSKEKFGENTFDYSLMNYINSSTKITLRCNRCGNTFEIIPSVHLESKTGCKICNRQKSYMMISKQELLNELKNISVEILDDHEFYYRNKEKYRFKCMICGNIFKKSIMYILKYNQYCPKCAFKKPKSNFENLIQDATFDISNYELLDEYKGKFKEHRFRCKRHNHIFTTTPEKFIEHSEPCELCYNEKKIKKLLDRAESKKLQVIKYNGLLHNSEVKVKCRRCGTEFVTTWENIRQAEFGGCAKCSFQLSKGEQEIVKFLTDKLNIPLNDIMCGDTKKYHFKDTKLEIDIYIPKYKLGIEYDGMLFHSFGKDHPNNFESDYKKHKFDIKKKQDLADSEGITLLNIWESEWINPIKREIWKSIIKSKLGIIDQRIYARKCEIKEISDIKTVKDFLENNHIQGYHHSHINLGLYYNNQLVQLMTFYKESDTVYKLQRLCSLTNTVVIGGASKLLKYFVKKYNPLKIITYSNRRWSKGNIYFKLGFKFKHISDPNYFYFKSNNLTKTYSRNTFQKHSIKQFFQKEQRNIKFFQENMSEIENMINNGYRIIYDAGNYVFEYIPETN